MITPVEYVGMKSLSAGKKTQAAYFSRQDEMKKNSGPCGTPICRERYKRFSAFRKEVRESVGKSQILEGMAREL